MPTTRTTRQAPLDGLRGVAALGVCVLHVATSSGLVFADGPLPWLIARLAIGVPLFFALSGFLLFRPWAERALSGAPAPRVGRYLRRRVLRVMPAYWLCVIVILAAWGGRDVLTWLKWLVLVRADETPATYHLWTLPVEMGFYLLLPFWGRLWGWWARRGADPAARLRRLLYGCALLGTVSIATVPFPDSAYWLPRHLIFFAAGMALCAVSVAVPERLRETVSALRGHLLVTAGLVYFLLGTPLAGPRFVAPPAGPYETLAKVLLETAVVVLLVTVVAGGAGGLLGNRTAAAFGRMSYSFYLWHAPVITFSMTILGMEFAEGAFFPLLGLTLAGTVAMAASSYAALERPFMSRPPSSPHQTVGAVSTNAPVRRL